MSRKDLGWVPLAVVLAVTGLVMLPVFWNGFVFDDLHVFLGSDRVHELANVPSFFLHNTLYVTEQATPVAVDTYRPLTLTTFAIDSLFTGRSPLGYHVTNLLLHLLCVGLVYSTARRLMAEKNRRYAWIAAAWFALSPWIGEAHIWINGRSDPLCTACVLGALLVWDRAIQSKRVSLYALSGLLLFAALLSKEVAMGVLPALLLWPALAASFPRWRDRIWPLTAPALAGGAYLLARALALGGMQSQRDLRGVFAALGNFGVLFFDGLMAAFVPSPPYLRLLSDSYGALSPGLLWLLTALALLLLAAAVLFRRRQPALSFSLVFFALTLAPVVVITTQAWPGFGRYLYLPIAGLAPGVVDGFLSGARRIGALDKPRMRRLLTIAVSAYLGLLAVLLHRFVYDFKSDGALYGAVIESAPEAAHGYGYLGLSLLNINQHETAVGYLEDALQRQPDALLYRAGLAKALIGAERPDEAVAVLEDWMRNSPREQAPEYLLHIALALEDTSPDAAVGAALACLRINEQSEACKRQLHSLWSHHERASEYKSIVRTQLQQPENQPIADLVLSRIDRHAHRRR